MSAPEGGGSKITPALIWGFAMAVGVGGGIAIVVFLYCLATGIDFFGAVQRRYPHVVMGFITLIVIGTLIAASRGGGGGTAAH